MNKEELLKDMLRNISPFLNEGTYVFVSLPNLESIPRGLAICEFHEKEGVSLIIRQDIADKLNLKYEYIAKWISLELKSELEAVGLTAAFSQALANAGISCNVVAGFYHDHIFVKKGDEMEALVILNSIKID